MASPEEKEKHRKRMKIRSKIAKSLRDPKFRKRVEPNHKKEAIRDMTHRELVERINEGIDFDE